MKRSLTIALFAFLATPSSTFAHDSIVYICTPATPPLSFWWGLTNLGVLVFAVFVTMKSNMKAGWAQSSIAAILSIALFLVVFYALGLIWAIFTNQYFPGPGPPSAPFFRWASLRLFIWFLIWNAISIFVLLRAVRIACRFKIPERREKAAHSMAFVAIIYVLLLVPFLSEGMFGHGKYAEASSVRQLVDLNRACYRYAWENDGKFPVAEDIRDLIPQIEPYIERMESRHENPIYYSPRAWGMKKYPKRYIWNEEMSGQEAPFIEDDSFDLVFPVSDPYWNELPEYHQNHFPIELQMQLMDEQNTIEKEEE